jgi:hypothetical protein
MELKARTETIADVEVRLARYETFSPFFSCFTGAGRPLK